MPRRKPLIKILVADDHVVVREGLIRIIDQTSDLKVVGEAESSIEVLQKIRSIKVDVLLLDLGMPGRGGLEVIKQIKIEYPDLPVLVFSMHPEDQYEVRVLKAGASGYLNKRTPPDQLLNAIRNAHSGKKFLSPIMNEKLATNLRAKPTELPHELLSDREFEVLCFLAAGKRIIDIAQQLGLSSKTITSHRERILKKMKLKTNADLTRYCIEKKISIYS